MDMLSLVGLVAAVTAVTALPYWLFTRWTKARAARHLLQFAERLDLAPQSDDDGPPTMAVGRYRGRPITVEHTYTTERGFPLTRLTVAVESPFPFEVRIRGRSFFATTPEEQYVRFDDPALDEALLLATTDEAARPALFDDTVRTRLRTGLTLGMTAGEVTLHGDHARYADPSHMLSAGAVERLAHAADLLVDLSDRAAALD